MVGIKNEIEENQVGLTYAFQNQKTLEEIIIKLLSNPDLKSELKQHIPSYLVTKTFENHFSELQKVYENLVGRNG